MPVNPYITFNGNCREAVTHYAAVFETEPPRLLAFGDMPEDPGFPIPEEAKKRIMHTNLTICGSTVMFSDLFPGMEYTVGNHMSLAVVTDDRAKIERYFHQLSEGGTVEMELQKTDWSPLYASLIDRYGISWQLNCSAQE